ncbi:MAG TPA: alcohol dehydrogenase catalytic domain-containing protein [Candidatus Binataceae bacterium]|jgi:(R,R)-butanediol dehydrogenase/meso-butanediol dehydrogenase/diacetyl reductase|nr:alcohol dehydrogenase catalytic domain-containing protein [Candidatus Binataceae bacterium]
MKAILYKGRDQLQMGEVPKPSPGSGEVLLKVHNCGICGSDLHAVQFGLGMKPDCILGHEFCGEIAEIGRDVRGFETGERVVVVPFSSCGACEFCLRGQGYHCAKMKSVGLGPLPGAYAEFIACSQASVLKLPDRLNSRQGALVEPLSVGLHGVNRSRLKPGTPCVIMGAGPVGLATLLWCKAKGADPVVVSEIAPGRRELAQKFGASAVVNPREYNPGAKVKELCGKLPQIVFECIGVKSTLGEAVGLVDKCGQVVVIGVCMEPDQIMLLQCFYKEVDINFALAYTLGDFDETIAALAGGKLNADALVTDVIKLEQVPAAFEMLRKPTTQAKVLIEFPH